MDKNPATVRALSELMMAGLDPGRGGGPLHARLRYFDPIRRRAGVPEDIAALVDQVGKDSVSVTLVNINQSRVRELVVQCGAYAENEISLVSLNGAKVAVNGPSFHLRIEPGCGARLTLNHSLYSRQPTLHFPWDQ
jgi:hypothetical protein